MFMYNLIDTITDQEEKGQQKADLHSKNSTRACLGVLSACHALRHSETYYEQLNAEVSVEV